MINQNSILISSCHQIIANMKDYPVSTAVFATKLFSVICHENLYVLFNDEVIRKLNDCLNVCTR